MNDENYNIDDVTTWSNEEFHQKTEAKLRGFWTKTESIKNLMRDGKYVIAHEQLQGMGDAIGFLVKLTNKRTEHLAATRDAEDS